MAIAKFDQGAKRSCLQYTVALSAIGILALCTAPLAVADQQVGAPITFADVSPKASTQYMQYASAPVSSAKVQGGSKRVEYRYPDQPNMAYGEQGPRQLSFGAKPIAFSSSKSAVTLKEAQQISGSRNVVPPAPVRQHLASMPARDPALTPGAFDARATAANIASNVADKVGRSTRNMVDSLAQRASRNLAERAAAKRHPNAYKVARQQKVAHQLASTPPVGFAKQKIGAPYEIQGRWYVPFAEPNYDEVGIGSWYGPQFHGKASAVGETFDQNALTAAHPTLPIPSLARVTNLENGRSIVVRINDRGPFVDDRLIDLSKKSATVLGYKDNGTAKVRVQYMGFAPEEHNSVPAKYVEEARRVLASTQAGSTHTTLIKASYSPRPVQKQIAALPYSKRQHPAETGYLLQAGVFGELANAHQLRARLHPFGKVFVKEARINGRDMFKVYVGSWSSRQQASQAKLKLAGNGFDSLIVSN